MNDNLKQAICGILFFVFLMWLAGSCTVHERPDPENYPNDKFIYQ